MIDFSTPFQDFNNSRFLKDFLPEDLTLHKEDLIKQSYQKYITEGHILGTVKSLNLSILEFKQTSEHDPRVSLVKEAFRIMADHGVRRWLVIFWNPKTRNWRLSLMTINLDIDEKNKIVRNYSNAKRFSFLLWEGEAMKTPRTQLSWKVKDFEDLQKRFSVEVVRKEFFDDYIDLFIRLYIEISKDVSFVKVLSEQGIDRVKFTKNLLGKIIFVYFVQKKWWLGLDRDKKWWEGDKNFMRSLWERFASGDIFVRPSTGFFYNDYLEHLFYNGFNKDRRDDDGYEPNMRMKVPYLNGGLFKEDYRDWEHFVAEISNDIFSNSVKNGILDIFDTYNFTIDEDDLTDAEIAVDPEMLGKIFEKMISVSKDNIDEIVTLYQEKGKVKIGTELNKKFGAFYTPREIVHYMTRESLITYLSTNTSGKKEDNESKIRSLINAKDQHLSQTETLQLFGNDISHISAFAQEVDTYLQKVKIIDPAVWSGAFPMGILHEVTTLRYYLHSEGFCTNHHHETEEWEEELTEDGKVSMYQIKRETIKNSIYGVDIEPGAIDIARLRFWLSLVVDAQHPEPLPNFEFNFVSANTLLPLFEEDIGNQTQLSVDDSLKIERLREFMRRFYNANTKKEKEDIQNGFKNYINKKYRIDDHKQLALEWSFTPRQKQIIEFNPFNNNHSNPFFDSALMMSVFRGFDIAIGNPPYGTSLKWEYRETVNDYLGKVPDFEIYYYFIEIGEKLLKKGWILNYIIPNTFLFNVFAKKYRLSLLENWQVYQIIDCTNFDLFENATVRNAIPLLIKGFTTKNIKYKKTNWIINHTSLLEQPDSSISKEALLDNITNWWLAFKLWDETLNLIKKIKNSWSPLDGDFIASQGYIPYRKSDLIKKYWKEEGSKIVKEKLWHSIEKKNFQYKQEIDGRNLTKYSYTKPQSYVFYWKHLACYVDEKFFNQPRILVREITNPGIIACYIEEELVNDPQIISIISNGGNLFFLWCLLNSKLATFYHFNSSPKATKGAFPKILVTDLKNFPIKQISIEKQEIFISLANQILETKKLNPKIDTSEIEKRIDQLVYELYDLTADEIGIIEGK